MKIDFWNKTQICTQLSPAPRYQVHQNFTKIQGVFLHVPQPSQLILNGSVLHFCQKLSCQDTGMVQ